LIEQIHRKPFFYHHPEKLPVGLTVEIAYSTRDNLRNSIKTRQEKGVCFNNKIMFY
jgi:hypothetical protein